MNIRKPLIAVAAGVAFLLLVFGIRTLILGGVNQASFKSSPEQQAAPAISNPTNTLDQGTPIFPGSDSYGFKNTKYFDNKKWLVATVVPKDSSFDNGTIVMQQKDDGTYQTFLGPGTSFSEQSLETVPKDVVTYIKSIAPVYSDQ